MPKKNNKSNVMYFTTPKGEAKYIFVNAPQTTYNPDGTYSVVLLLDAKSPATQSLCADLDQMLIESKQEALAKIELIDKACTVNRKKLAPEVAKKTLRETLMEVAPYSPEYDDEGQETGMLIFKFKMNRLITVKGEQKEQAPEAFDCRNNLVDLSQVNVGKGSIVKVRCKARPWFMLTNAEYGVSTFLNQLQILELKEFAGEGNGFEAEEGGYEASSNYLDKANTPSNENLGGYEGGEDNDDPIPF